MPIVDPPGWSTITDTIDGRWRVFEDDPDIVNRGYILQDPDHHYPVGYYSDRILREGWLVVKAAGVSYRLDTLQDAAFDPGHALMLQLEPENPKDPNAIAIWDIACQKHIGYVPRDQAPEIRKRLTAGEELYGLCLMEIVSRANHQRVGIRLLIAPLKSFAPDLWNPPGRSLTISELERLLRPRPVDSQQEDHGEA